MVNGGVRSEKNIDGHGYNDDFQALNAIKNNTELTEQEKWRAIDRVLNLPLGSLEKSAKKAQTGEEKAHPRRADQRATIKAMLTGSKEETDEISGNGKNKN